MSPRPRTAGRRAPIAPPALAAAVFLGAVVLAGCRRRSPPPASAPAPPAAAASGHQRMIAALRAVAARTDEENEILGDREARALRGRLAELPAGDPSPQRLDVLIKLGAHELRLNNLDTGIGHLTEARRLIEKLDLERGVDPSLLLNSAYLLGVAYLRVGETQNCCAQRSPESCILPIRGGGLHTRPGGSRRAMGWFTEVLRAAPRGSTADLKARWLLNLAAMTLGEYPEGVPAEYRIDPAVFAPEEPFPRFPNVAAKRGLDAFDLAGGAIADDFDGDGDLDLVVSTWDPEVSLHFYRNAGDGTFTEDSAAANLTGITGGFNLLQADYDNDGDLDVLVLRGAWLGRAGRIPNSLLRNDGTARFTDVSFEAGLAGENFPTQTAGWADYDHDGDLDLFIGNEVAPGFSAPCQLFRNDGHGRFADVARAAGVQNFRQAKSVAWGDYDGDGFPDLYVSNLGQANRLYHNDGDGTFTDVAVRLGVTEPLMSFPAWFWDFDNDGALDLYVAGYDFTTGNLAAYVADRLDLRTPAARPHLYRGVRCAEGRPGFENVAAARGVDDVTLPMGANFGDLDGDGWLDFYLGTGYPDYEGLMPNVLYHNRGGADFADVTTAGGFGHLQKGHAVVFADLDHDGDLDLFEQIGGFFPGDRFANALFENPGFGYHHLTVTLVGTRSNRSAFGARLRVDVVEDGRARSIRRTVGTGGSFGANPLTQTIGVGRATRIERLRVRWPASGITRSFEEVPLDRDLRIVEGEEAIRVLDPPPRPAAAAGGGGRSR